jgi:hypothetical protein
MHEVLAGLLVLKINESLTEHGSSSDCRWHSGPLFERTPWQMRPVLQVAVLLLLLGRRAALMTWRWSWRCDYGIGVIIVTTAASTTCLFVFDTGG